MAVVGNKCGLAGWERRGIQAVTDDLPDMNLMTREFLLGIKQAVSFRDSSNDN